MGLAKQAEEYCVAKFSLNAKPSKYIAGFTTRLGRQVAIERDRGAIYCWTEQTSLSTAPCSPAALYPASKTRTSALNGKHASRLRVGQVAQYWHFEHFEEFKRFIEWYA
jgi:hypothetical protein